MITFSVKLELIILMTIFKFTGYPFKRFYFDKYVKTYKARNYLNSVHLYSERVLSFHKSKKKVNLNESYDVLLSFIL